MRSLARSPSSRQVPRFGGNKYSLRRIGYNKLQYRKYAIGRLLSCFRCWHNYDRDHCDMPYILLQGSSDSVGSDRVNYRDASLDKSNRFVATPQIFKPRPATKPTPDKQRTVSA